MGKIAIRIFVFILILLVTTISIRLFNNHDNKILLKIFNESNYGNIFNKFFNIIPNKYFRNYEIICIEKFKEYELLKITDKNQSVNNIYIVLVRSNNEKYYFVKADFNLKNKNLNSNNFHSKLIDKAAFNKLVNIKNLSSEKDIVDYYIKLSSLDWEEGSYKKLSYLSDLRILIEQKPLKNKRLLNELGYKIIDKTKIELSKSNNSELHYYWIYNMGIVEYRFKIEDSQIINVSSKGIGYLGNEIPTCC